MAKRAIIHCSDSAWGNAAVISRWHVLDNGWRAIGYNYVILNERTTRTHSDKEFNGVIETGRGLDEDGAHTKGENDAIGICLIGKSGQFTRAQIDALLWLLKHLDIIYGKLEVYQHSDYDNKKYYCAGLSKEQLKEIETR